MGLSKTIWTSPSEFLRNQQPEHPVMFFAPSVLQATARRFLDGFPGLVTYAVKSNPDEIVIQNLVAAGRRRRAIPAAALLTLDAGRIACRVARLVSLLSLIDHATIGDALIQRALVDHALVARALVARALVAKT